MLIYFVLRSLIRTIDLSVEGTSVRIFSNKFGKSLTYSYLCQRHQGCMADIGLAENIPSNDLNRVVPA